MSEIEIVRRIPPTRARVDKLTLKTLRWRLREEKVAFRSDSRKPALVQALYDYLSENAGASVAGANDTDNDTATAGASDSVDASDADNVVGGTPARIRPGDSVEVWWDQPEGFFPCVIVSQQPDVRDTTASLCYYDDGEQR